MDDDRADWWSRLMALLAELFGGQTGGAAPRRRRPAPYALGRGATAPPEVDLTPVPVGAPLKRDLLLLTGTTAVPLFPAGPLDPLQFFQRRGVEEEHDVEWIVRHDPDAPAGEELQPWAVVRLREDLAVTLADPKRAESFWRDLYRAHGVATLPRASALTKGLAPSAFDLRAPDPAAGRNVLACTRPDAVWKKVAGKRLTHRDALSFVRQGLRGVHLIAWIEEAFPKKLPAGEVVHRYYVDRGHVYLLRHHWAHGKRLYLAQPSAEALPLLASDRITRLAA
jgi:hypothetical protein